MGVNFVISVENLNNRTQEEVNRKFGVSKHFGDKFPEWELFKYQGKHYAAWLMTPRYFQMEEKHMGKQSFLLPPNTLSPSGAAKMDRYQISIILLSIH
jgi:hypothetical protein